MQEITFLRDVYKRQSKYKAFEIQDDKVSETVVEGNLIAIADFIKNCKEGSIITIHMLEVEPFLIGLSKLFLYCEDNEFLNNQLIPYLRGICCLLYTSRCV